MNLEEFQTTDWRNDPFRKRAGKFLSARYPQAVVAEDSHVMVEKGTDIVEKVIHLFVATDTQMAIRQKMVAIEDVRSSNEISAIALQTKTLFDEMMKVEVGFHSPSTGYRIDPGHYTVPKKTILYSSHVHIDQNQAINFLNQLTEDSYEMIDEQQILSTVFISYGKPDEKFAGKINERLKQNGVKTWFFPTDAVPGDKLHRAMSNGVVEHDRVLLICSKSSLERGGVLNEIERVLEREAREGGTSILIPITIDDFVFSDWALNRPDISQQIQSRVIGIFSNAEENEPEFNKQFDKLLISLKK